MDSSNRSDTEVCRSGTEALIEMGVKTGLSLIFSLLRQNWMNESTAAQSVNLCNDVLHTALNVVMSLPPLSLANESKLPPLGVSTLNQVTRFLRGAVMPTSGADDLGRKLSSQLVLAVAAQRGSLRYLLEWVEMSLCATASMQRANADSSGSDSKAVPEGGKKPVSESKRGISSPDRSNQFEIFTDHPVQDSPPGKVSYDLFIEIVRQMKKTAVGFCQHCPII